MWLNDNYLYRRKLEITSIPEPLVQYSPITVQLPIQTYDNGKLRDDHQDLEIIYVDPGENHNPIYRTVERTNNSLEVTFALAEALDKSEISRDYYVYYGNPTLAEQAVRDANVYVEWPVSYSYNNSKITYTRPGEHWQDGVSSHVGARATFYGYASDIRLVFEGLNDRGIAEVSLDGDLMEVDTNVSQAEIPTNVYLSYSNLAIDQAHEMRISVTGKSTSASKDPTIKIKSIDVVRPAGVDVLGEELNQAVWSSSVGGA